MTLQPVGDAAESYRIRHVFRRFSHTIRIEELASFSFNEHDKSQPRQRWLRALRSVFGTARQPPGVTQAHKALATMGRGQWHFLESRMADILTDYREWASAQEERVGTHSGRCHLWHERCMIHRLAAELERTRAALVAVAQQDGTLSVSDGRLFVDCDGVEELAFDYEVQP